MHELNILVEESKDTENVADDTGQNRDECEDTRDEVSADGQDVRLFFWLSTLKNDGGCKRSKYRFIGDLTHLRQHQHEWKFPNEDLSDIHSITRS